MAKYIKLFKALKANIMVIEEAGEVLETHTLSILHNELQHLIMIGDHQQLKPKINSYELERMYKYNMSLFERLIIQDVPKVTLQYQRRMKTELAD
jgi:superfamily I DNA and/or RNA helicase